MSSLYQLESVRQAYDGRTVLDLASLEIRTGEVLAIVGPSGVGKSTLLRLLNFLEPPTMGSIRFEGNPVPPDAPLELRRRVTTVFQRPALLSRTVRDNVALGLRWRGMNPDDAVDDALQRVGLDSLAGVRATKLSGGEMQRVALARTLVLRPDVLLLDEPTANLDPYNVGLIEAIVREQNAERGTTVVLVTHNVFQARRLAHRVGLLLNGATPSAGGRMVELARTEDFFEHPRDARTAAFVRGEMPY